MYDITILQIYYYFFKSSSSFDEIGKGGESPPLVLNFQGSIRMSPIFIVQYLDLSLSLECLTKGVMKQNPLLNPLNTNRMEQTPLMNHKEA